MGQEAKFSSSCVQPNHRRQAKVSVETLGRKPVLRDLLKMYLASAQGTARETQKLDILGESR